MTLFELTTQAMDFMEENWMSYDRDWGRWHADDCRYTELKDEWKRLEQEHYEEETRNEE